MYMYRMTDGFRGYDRGGMQYLINADRLGDSVFA